MITTAKLRETDSIEVEITIRAPLGDWKRIAAALDSASTFHTIPAEFLGRIRGIVRQVEREFALEDET